MAREELLTKTFVAMAAGVMLAKVEGTLQVEASSSEAVRVLELFELQANEGPCLDCIKSGEPVINENLAVVNGRWPNFAPVALAAGYKSVHALPLRLGSSIIGALNIFSDKIKTLSESDAVVAQALADMATIVILSHRRIIASAMVNEQLTFALNSRIVIEQAKGVLSATTGQSMEQAFTLMRNYARSNNVLLHDVAQGVVDRTVSAEALEMPRKK